MLDEHRDVFAPLAQWRDADHHDRDAVVEIGAEGPGIDALLGILVGRSDEPDVGADRLGAADLDELAALDHAQQLGLQRRAELAQLVDEERAGIGLREDAFAVLDGAGEGAAHVAEQLTLREILGHGRAIEGHQRGIAPVADRVDGAGDQFLAGPALTVDADVRVARGGLLDAREHVEDLLGLSDEPVEGRALAPRGQPRRRRARRLDRRQSAQQRIDQCRQQLHRLGTRHPQALFDAKLAHVIDEHVRRTGEATVIDAFGDRRRVVVTRRVRDENVLGRGGDEQRRKRAHRGDLGDFVASGDKHRLGAPDDLVRRIEHDYLQRRLLPHVRVAR